MFTVYCFFKTTNLTNLTNIRKIDFGSCASHILLPALLFALRERVLSGLSPSVLHAKAFEPNSRILRKVFHHTHISLVPHRGLVPRSHEIPPARNEDLVFVLILVIVTVEIVFVIVFV